MEYVFIKTKLNTIEIYICIYAKTGKYEFFFFHTKNIVVVERSFCLVSGLKEMKGTKEIKIEIWSTDDCLQQQVQGAQRGEQ